MLKAQKVYLSALQGLKLWQNVEKVYQKFRKCEKVC